MQARLRIAIQLRVVSRDGRLSGKLADEIGGGQMVWQWWRNGIHWSVGTLGAMILILL